MPEETILNQVGSWASIIGASIGFIGFVITIIIVWKTKSAAQLTEKVVSDVRKDIRRIDTVSECSTAIAVMESILNLNRSHQWISLLEKYISLKKTLISIESNPDLNDDHKVVLLNAVQTFTGIEGQVERAVENNTEPDDIPNLNATVAEQIGELQRVLAEIRNLIGG